jgi:hypothetical protein
MKIMLMTLLLGALASFPTLRSLRARKTIDPHS